MAHKMTESTQEQIKRMVEARQGASFRLLRMVAEELCDQCGIKPAYAVYFDHFVKLEDTIYIQQNEMNFICRDCQEEQNIADILEN